MFVYIAGLKFNVVQRELLTEIVCKTCVTMRIGLLTGLFGVLFMYINVWWQAFGEDLAKSYNMTAVETSFKAGGPAVTWLLFLP